MLASELNESKFGNSLAALGMAAGIANANMDMKPVHGYDAKYGNKTSTLFQQRYDHKFDADDYKYEFNRMPDKLDKIAYDSLDIEATKEKILATPDSLLSKYGKANVNKIAKYVVDASDKYDIDVNILLAVLSTETNFDQNRVSDTGVRSIAQITNSTLTDLQTNRHIDKHHSIDKIVANVKDAIYASADMINYFSTHMHNNIEMIFAEYNGGALGGASPYRMYRQGMSKDKIISWMKRNGCTSDNIKHFFTETIPYVQKCMKAYKYYLEIDDHA